MNPNEIAAAARIWRNRHETRLTNLNGPGGYAACISDEAERWAADILADAYLAHLAEHAAERDRCNCTREPGDEDGALCGYCEAAKLSAEHANNQERGASRGE